MKQQRLALLHEIDRQSKVIALKFASGSLITEDILKTIIELYASAQVERVLVDDFFEAAYHAPVTGELEFFIARIIFHFSNEKNLHWKVLLRRQESSVAPDIRILKDGKTISIIEIKAKGGWIQPFLSSDRYKNDKIKFEAGHPFNPQDLIDKQQLQLSKYTSTFNLDADDIFFLLPTMALVHRKKYNATLEDYYHYFSLTSKISKDNFILLSTNLRLDLAFKPDLSALQPTNNFEKMLQRLMNKYNGQI